jgi:hypothetical protein
VLLIALAIWVAGLLVGGIFAVPAALRFARRIPRLRELATAADSLAAQAAAIEASVARTRAATDFVRTLGQGR